MTEQPQDFDRIVTTDKTSYGLKATQLGQGDTPKQPAAMLTDIDGKKMFLMRPAETEKDTGEVIDASIHVMGASGASPHPVPSSTFPENVRAALAETFKEAAAETGVAVADEVLENLLEGKESMKAPEREERQQNASYKRIMKGTNLDAEAAEAIAGGRTDELLDEFNAAIKAGDEGKQAQLKERLKEASAQQPELDEAAALLPLSERNPRRAQFDEKHAGTAVEGEMQEQSHVDRLNAKRAEAEAQKENGQGGQSL